ncbi:hypothetical protein [Enterovibrio nigricans]|nr:hypothetical protein [Enterovibrio nigricans]PKF49396.1 hypothetical protein AT251_19195 [Enterovibrio nigricans]
MLHHIPEFKQHLVENKFSKAAHRDVLGVIYILDCFLTNRHKHMSHDKNGDGYVMSLDYMWLDKLFTQAARKKLVRWKESDLLGNTAVVNPEHLLSKFMFTTGTYDMDSGESREWYIRDNMAYRLMDFVAGYANHVKNIPHGFRESGRFGKVSVCQHGKVDKWLDTKTGETYNRHSELASKLGVSIKSIEKYVKSGRVVKNPDYVHSNRVGFSLYDRYIDT